MKFYFAGQSNFGNRGCEALVRSIVGLIKTKYPDANFFCPSSTKTLDEIQWKSATQQGVIFTSVPDFPKSLQWWARGCRVLPVLESLTRPRLASYDNCTQDISSSSAMIFTGGDNLGLDYGVASLYHWANFAEKSIDMGVPAILWAASVGPFTAKPAVEREMVKHLKRYAAITVRESATYEYLQGLGVSGVTQVADPAFTMSPEAFDVADLTFGHNSNILGLNVSPLVRGYRKDEASRDRLDRDVVDFIKDIVTKTDMSVLLVPHVDPLDGSSVNSDSSYMQGLLAQLSQYSGRVKLAPRHLNAAQLKYLISHCRFFIGARTHATIGAFSTGVPTISIAYSVKAKGINRDLFGDTRFVLDTPLVTRDTLHDSLNLLIQEEVATRALLQERIPVFRENAYKSVDVLASVLKDSR
jgi:polysaccharide pyruvyl transferase WcaK-like protein